MGEQDIPKVFEQMLRSDNDPNLTYLIIKAIQSSESGSMEISEICKSVMKADSSFSNQDLKKVVRFKLNLYKNIFEFKYFLSAKSHGWKIRPQVQQHWLRKSAESQNHIMPGTSDLGQSTHLTDKRRYRDRSDTTTEFDPDAPVPINMINTEGLYYCSKCNQCFGDAVTKKLHEKTHIKSHNAKTKHFASKKTKHKGSDENVGKKFELELLKASKITFTNTAHPKESDKNETRSFELELLRASQEGAVDSLLWQGTEKTPQGNMLSGQRLPT